MDRYSAATYGESFAAVYDEWFASVSDVEGTVATVLEASHGGRVLELGVGTGRLALPLADRGVDVTGIDASTAMLERLGADVASPLGDMAVLPFVDDCFAVVFVAFNTFFNLTSAEAQQACIADVARVLVPGGRFILEAFVPPEPADAPASDVSVRTIEVDRVVLTVAKRDDAAQTITGQHIEMLADGNVFRPWLLRYLFPEQLDASLRASGLVLEHRWEDWNRRPFDQHSPTHVSVYRS